MPSRAERARGGLWIVLERVARTLALAIIAWLLYQSFKGSGAGPAAVSGVGSLPSELARWSTVAAPERVHIRVDSALSPVQRDWLVALRGAGARVGWDGPDVLPVAAVADPVADPLGATSIRAASPAGATVVLGDAFGVLDSVRASSAGARFLAYSAPTDVIVRAGPLVARSSVTDSIRYGRLLILGHVGWESKFVAAALEERGWKVDVKLALSPKGDVVQGTIASIDTGRYAAVIALDTTALASAARFAPYVRDGGGLIMMAPVSSASALAPLRVGTLGRRQAGAEPFDTSAADPRSSLGLTPISLAGDAVALEERGADVAIAARRVGRGRVIVVGYDDTWRWRMGGDANAADEHRAWWAGLVAAVAHVGREPRAASGVVDEAPLVGLVERLGEAVPMPASEADPSRRIPPEWLFAALAVALLLEWTSRRVRGER